MMVMNMQKMIDLWIKRRMCWNAQRLQRSSRHCRTTLSGCYNYHFVDASSTPEQLILNGSAPIAMESKYLRSAAFESNCKF
mmetsp:Transcript_6234/g.7687  ORF Transcript_6234/g.7687 Transcript_6234/m.7687 type:complete len:81 (-) Transcript_6234:1408-1650(-)